MKAKGTSPGWGVVGIGLAGLATIHSAQATTQITFGSFTANNIDISTIEGYGSHVSASSVDYVVSPGVAGITGTPDIALTWGVGYQTYIEWDGRGNVAQLDYNSGPQIDLVFTPAAGAGVLIGSFDLDAWSGATAPDISVAWSIDDSGGTLASGVWERSTGGRDTITTGLTASDIRIGESVTLRYSLNSGSPSYIALANLTFDQVPEPATVALGVVGLGLGALAMRRRRQ